MKPERYRREPALRYAARWAMGRNPAYYDFTDLGGDCTNFVSQCLFAGGCRMNFTPEYGWYYRSLNNRAPAWTGVEPFYRFLTEHTGPGPHAQECSPWEAQPGDVVQLADESGRFYHTMLILRQGKDPAVAAHDNNAWMRPLSDYVFSFARFLHIRDMG